MTKFRQMHLEDATFYQREAALYADLAVKFYTLGDNQAAIRQQEYAASYYASARDAYAIAIRECY